MATKHVYIYIYIYIHDCIYGGLYICIYIYIYGEFVLNPLSSIFGSGLNQDSTGFWFAAMWTKKCLQIRCLFFWLREGCVLRCAKYFDNELLVMEIIFALACPRLSWNQAMCCPFWSWALLKACLVFSMRLGARFGDGMVVWTNYRPQFLTQ